MDHAATFMLITVNASRRSAVQPVFREAVLDAGGSIVAGTQVDPVVDAARFELAIHATIAVVALARSGVGAEPSMRVALRSTTVTDPAVRTTDACLDATARLLEAAAPGQIVTDAPTAVAIEPTLPADIELFHLGMPARAGRHAAERTYELRATGTEPTGPVTSNLGWAHRAAIGPVLDRQDALAMVDDAWASTLRGRRRGVMLVGEGGMGKTAVAAEFAMRAHAAGALVLYGRWDRERISAYQAVREALAPSVGGRTGPELDDGFAEHCNQIRRLLPRLGARLGARHPPLAGDSEGERIALYDGVAAWLDRLAADRAVLVVLDDVHWAERSSLLLVDHVGRTVGPAPWMLLVTARATGGLPVSAEPAGGASVGRDLDRVELSGLSTGAVADLVCLGLGCAVAPDDAVVTWLTTATAGNPLFVQQILRAAGGTGTATDALVELHAARHRLPALMTEVVRWRVRHLAEPSRRLLADASVVAPSADLDLLSRAVSSPEVIVRSRLEPAVREELIRLEGDTDRCAFAHEVVRLALSEEVAPERSRLLHRRAAAVLEARASSQEVEPGEVAYHYLRGADPDTAAAAVRWARRGADAARHATGFDEAVRLLVDAVDVHERFGSEHDPGPDTLACELRLELAEAHDRAGQFAARDRRHLEAAALARDLGRVDLFARAALGFGGRLPAAPLPNPVGRALLEETLETLPAGDGPVRALALARLAHLRHLDAPYEVRRTDADEAVAMARRLGRPEILAPVLLAQCFALDGPDDVTERLSIGTEVNRIGQQIGDPDLELQGSRVRITALLGIGEHQAARELAASYAALARESRHQDHVRLATMGDIVWAGLAGRHTDVEAMAERLTEQLTTAGHAHSDFIHFAYTFVPRWLHGDLEQTRPNIDALASTDPASPTWWAISAWLDAATGPVDRTLARLDERDPATVVGSVERNFLWWPTMIACAVSSACGNRRWAEAVSRALEPYSGQSAVAGFALFLGAVDHHLGALDVVLGRPEPAVLRLRSALDHHRALDSPLFVALSASWLARALTVRSGPGDPEEASALVAEVGVLAERHGLTGLPRFDQRVDADR
ncbi:MAG: ATP-binding protein [Acidimicrobiales bacterium]